MESGLLAAELLSSDVQALFNDDFLALKNETSFDGIGEMSAEDSNMTEDSIDKPTPVTSQDAWDPDILLSNAGLPEMNPLLEIDGNLNEDYQRLLNDWENQLSAVQQPPEPNYIVDGLSFGVNRSQESIFDDLLRPSTSTSTTSDVSYPSIKLDPDEQDSNSFLMDSSAENSQDGSKENYCLTTERSGKMTLGKRTLAGVVISSGPGDYFETYEVLEASDAENLLRQFEATTSFENEFDDLDFEENASTILAAVQSHFASSNDWKGKKFPKIVPSRRIKDALPKEIVDRIKSSSQRSRTIAIIEPMDRAAEEAVSPNRSEYLNSKRSRSEPSVLSVGTRFQEAATSLQRSKVLRQMGISSGAHQTQVSLDHDYCSSANKATKRHRWNSVASVTPSSPYSVTSPKSASGVSSFQTVTSPKRVLPVTSSKYIPPSKPVTLKSTTSTRLSLPVMSSKPQTLTARNSSLLTINNKTVSSPIVIATTANQNSRPVVRMASGSSLHRYQGVSPSPMRVTGPKPTPVSIQSSSGVSSPPPRVSIRTEHDTKKDSGLESGEVSDASEGAQGCTEDDRVFSKVPSYLTSVNVENSDSRTIAEIDDPLSYDRLPAYVKGVSGATSSSVSLRNASTVVTLGESEEQSPAPSRSSFSRSRSPATSPSRHRRRDSLSPSRYSSRFRLPAASSSSDESDHRRSSSRRRSLKKRTNRRRSRSSSLSPSPPRRTHFRSRSPQRVGFSAEQQRLEQQQRQRRDEKHRQVEERRVVYVGKIAEGTTRADLRKRFDVFGPIVEISLHFRDIGDNYGFVTFKYKNDAYEAIEKGNDDPSYPKVDLCFGGRRAFCKEKYSDLDYNPPNFGKNSGSSNDFDTLLSQARAGLRKK